MKKPLGQLLKEMDLITEAEIQQALQVQREKGGALGKIFVEMGFVSEEDMNFALAAQYGLELVDLDNTDVLDEVIAMVDPNVAETYRIIPVAFEQGVLIVAMADPTNPMVLDDLHLLLNCQIQGAVSSEEAVQRALERYYGRGGGAESMDSVLGEMGEDVSLVEEADIADLEDLAKAAESTPVKKLLNLILLQGIKAHAADIHLEPYENSFRIRMRIDGVLYEMQSPPPHLAAAITSRIKVMSNLDIAETRLPQDGRIDLVVGGKPVDLRVSTLPTMFGESTVMRILDRSNVNLDLTKLGLKPETQTLIQKLVSKPNGIILVTGPTGSGKTTTLYSCLNWANTIDRKIITTEDPVEYDLPGIMQVPINDEIGVTYAACLRAILRQDPDMILVGEIRDLETAQMAVEAALTGHLVLSTLHTNDAPSAVTRLTDLGVENFLLSATVEGVVAQRLVRKICAECRAQYEPAEEEIYELDLRPEDVEGEAFYYGKGCKQCNNTGYRGRSALYEILVPSDEFRNMVMEDCSAEELRQCAIRAGMTTLRHAGLQCVFDGTTTIEEVVRETIL